MKAKELKNYPNIYGLMSKKIITLNTFIVLGFFVILFCVFIIVILLIPPIEFNSILVGIVFSLILILTYGYAIAYTYLSYKKLCDKCLQLVDRELAEAIIFNATPYPACLTKSFLILYPGASLAILNLSDLKKLDIGYIYTRGSSVPYIHVVGKSEKSSYKQSIKFVNKQKRNSIDILIKKTNEQIRSGFLENQ